jgi:uncharacterized protein YjbI with pentapeptide repeats
MPQPWAFMQRRKMLRLLAISRHRQRIAFLMGMVLLLALVVWLGLSGKAHAWLAKLASTRSWILAHPQPLPEVLVVVGILVVLALWLLPKWQAARSQGLTAGNRFDRENEARKTLAQIIGGVLVLAGLYSSLQTFSLQQHTFDLQRESQITDRFTKAIDQLGAVETGADGKPKINLEVRLGGIYALERIAHDSPTDYWTIVEVLSTYVRENSPATNNAGKAGGEQRPPATTTTQPAKVARKHPRADIQAILTVIGRRDITRDPQNRHVDLSLADLSGANLTYAHLEGANLIEAHLEGADLSGVHLSGAHLSRTNLIDAHLTDADLTKADLGNAYLTGADLTDADLTEALLIGAHLSRAHFIDADLIGALLIGADLSGTDLNVADLSGADLIAAHLIRANLTAADLSGAHITRADLTAADLTAADLTAADLTGAYLSLTDLSGAHLTRADLSGADLSRAYRVSQSQLNAARGDLTTKLPEGGGLTRPVSWH